MTLPSMTKASKQGTKRHGSPRQGSIYIAVSGTALLISLIGFTSLHLSRLELRRATAHNERAYARQLAYSGVEFAIAAINLDSNWRTNYSHGTENSRDPSGTAENLHFRYLDNADNDLANDETEPVEIQGIGRYGGATAIYSVTYASSVTSDDQSLQQVLQSYEGTPASNFTINKWNYTGQHFIASLPAEAITWDILSIDIYVQQSGSGGDETLYVKFYTSDGSGQPSTLLETATVPESDLPATSYDWYSVAFSSITGLTPGQGLCLALEGGSATNNVCEVAYDTGITQIDSHRLDGSSSSWSTPRPSESILFRVHGVYTTSGGSGEFTVTPGSWRTIAAP